MDKMIVGREAELDILKSVLASKESEFVAVYGRRRVGKTYLIRHFFRSSNCIFFEITGQKDAPLKEQLENFATAVQKNLLDNIPIRTPTSWKKAFLLLTNLLKKRLELDKNKVNVVLFFDELPWLAGKRSKFVQALDYIWNTEWVDLDRMKLIVCGSAASWMLDNLVHAKGGLHNRLTRTLSLEPFTLAETKKFLKRREINLNAEQILELYMVMGGIPFYLKAVNKGLSAAQNIDALCFKKGGLLVEEFDRLFSSLFESFDDHIEIVHRLASKRNGLTQNEILKKIKLSSGGTFMKRLKELEAAGFIKSFLPYKKEKKGTMFRLIDEYTVFYLKWIESFSKKGGTHFWQKMIHTPEWYNWGGIAFESLCYKHIDNIKVALRIDRVAVEVCGWQFVPKNKKEKGAQIDLLFDRADRVITLCEIKFSQDKFIITKEYAENLRNKIKVFQEQTKTNKSILLAIVTPFGLKENEFSRELISNIITMDDLFLD